MSKRIQFLEETSQRTLDASKYLADVGELIRLYNNYITEPKLQRHWRDFTKELSSKIALYANYKISEDDFRKFIDPLNNTVGINLVALHKLSTRNNTFHVDISTAADQKLFLDSFKNWFSRPDLPIPEYQNEVTLMFNVMEKTALRKIPVIKF